MRGLVIGTTNPAKARQCELALRGTGIRTLPLLEVLPDPPPVREGARDAPADAARKAQRYSELLARAVISLDFALVLDGVAEERQPGDVRRIPGVEGRAGDEKLVDHYSRLVASCGGRVSGRWEAGAAVAAPGGALAAASIFLRRTFVAEPSPIRIPGYPLASLQLADDGRYLSELDAEEEERHWQRTLRVPLRELAETALAA
jgi:hypothetical protein